MAAAARTHDEALTQICPGCGRANRVLRHRMDEAPRCGACKTPLFSTGPVTVSDATWQREVERSPVPVLVDFWAPWCGPCRAIAPTIDAIARDWAGRLKVVKVDVDQNPATAARFAVQAVPTMMIFRGGRPVDEVRGALPRPALEARIAAAVR